VSAVGVNVEVDAKKLLKTLSRMSKDARQRLEAKAIRQALGPFQRGVKQSWKSLPVKKPSGKRVRYWAARAIRMTVDRFQITSRLTTSGRRERYGKVFISYKNRYRSARMAHLLENPRGNYRTAGPMNGIKRKSGTPGRKYGQSPNSYRVHSKAFDRYKGQARNAFMTAVRLFLMGYQTKDIRKSIKGIYG